MKTIVFVTTELSPGGAEIMLQRLVTRLDRNRFSPKIITLKPKDRRITPGVEARGIPVHSLGLSTGRPSLKALRRLRRLLRTLEPDVIQGWMYHGNFAATLATLGTLRSVPLYWSIHHSLYSLSEESLSTRLVLAISRLLARRASAIAYVSSASARHHEARGFPARLTVFTPNGFDTESFKPSESARREARRELGIKPEDVVIGSLSRYIPLKDYATFFAAAGLLARKHPEACFLLMGHGVHERNGKLMEAVREQGLESRIHLLGHRPDTHRLLPAMDIMTNSSYSEAFPLSVGEAMASALPCVATDVGDTALLMGDTGVLVPPRNPEAIYKAWVELIEAGPLVRWSLGRRARRRIIDHFTLEATVRRYEALYESGPAPLIAVGGLAS